MDFEKWPPTLPRRAHVSRNRTRARNISQKLQIGQGKTQLGQKYDPVKENLHQTLRVYI